jgi:hypothetical protein
MHDASWKKIFEDYDIYAHDFDKSLYIITAEQIKRACQDFKNTGEKEVRIRKLRGYLKRFLIKREGVIRASLKKYIFFVTHLHKVSHIATRQIQELVN